jgi:dipeptidyl-peptidase 4
LTRNPALLTTAFCALGFLQSLVASQVAGSQEPGVPLTVEKIYAHGPLIGRLPEDVEWSPDGKHLSYLDGGELVDLDPGSGKPHVLVSRSKISSIEGAPASEQDRDHRLRYKMAAYQWAPDSQHLLFDSNGRLWMFDLHTGIGVELGSTGQAFGDDPKFSPDGEFVSFVRGHGLSVMRLKDAGIPPMVLASSPNETIWNGEVDWVYEEELDVRSNYFWSPDSKNIAFLQMNEADVPLYPLTDWIPTHAGVVLQRYPQPGDANPNVRVGVVAARGGKISWVKLPVKPDQDYIPRFGWVDRKTIWAEVVTRDQKHRTLYFAEAGGTTRQMLDISDEKFLDEDYDVDVDSGDVVLTNWSDGHNHIYLYKYDRANPTGAPASLDRQLTKGDFEVSSIYSVDHQRKLVTYASNEGNVQQEQIWQVSFAGERKRLSSGPGNHQPIFSPSGTSYSDKYSMRMNPPQLELCKVGDSCQTYWSTHALDPYSLHAPESLDVKAHDGTTLYATLLLPPDATNPASVPLIVNPYGGPGPQEVADRWDDGLLFDELLAERGFAVLHADNRGTGMRGRDFAQVAYQNFGPVQLEDQLTVLDAALQKYPQLDPKRLGWWGWSWGGTFTLYALSHSDRFRAGVSVAPVTDWRNYDSIYTERYLGTPSENSSEYKDLSAVNAAANLKGRLLLVHGTGDDNVHFENSVQYIQKLIDADLPYDFQIFPRKTHSLAGPEAKTNLYQRILAHFEQYLMPPAR